MIVILIVALLVLVVKPEVKNTIVHSFITSQFFFTYSIVKFQSFTSKSFLNTAQPTFSKYNANYYTILRLKAKMELDGTHQSQNRW